MNHNPITRECEILRNVKIPMRDGVRLTATIVLPLEEGPYPTILLRTPYFRLFRATRQHWAEAITMAQHGYATVLQDTRGRYDSEGDFYPYLSEAEDGYDTLEWVGAQPWCNGNVGMIGASYEAGTQYLAATQGSKYLKSIAPMFMTGDPWQRGYYADGAFSLALNLLWLSFVLPGRTREDAVMPAFNFDALFRELPLLSLDVSSGSEELAYWRDYVLHFTRDDFWRSQSIRDHYQSFIMPALLIGGWYDYYVGEGFKSYQEFVAHAASPAAVAQHRVIVGPWPHGIFTSAKFGDVDFGESAIIDQEAVFLDWFEHTLKSQPQATEAQPSIRLFVMGINQWRDEHEWPLARTRYTSFYLRSGGAANSGQGDGTLSLATPGDEPPDRYLYDPNDPVPTLGGNHSVGMLDAPEHMMRPGPFDQAPVESRGDVLVYTSLPLEQDTEVTGPITLRLYAASSAPDTDFVGKLTDVHPDGRSINLTEGVIRARFRARDWAHPKLIEPNVVYEYEIDLQVTSNVFKKGHRIRLQITSSNFPLWDRNPNTGHTPGLDSELRVASQSIFHDPEHPSHLVLPVIP